jgi:subtilisin family serine protease
MSLSSAVDFLLIPPLKTEPLFQVVCYEESKGEFAEILFEPSPGTRVEGLREKLDGFVPGENVLDLHYFVWRRIPFDHYEELWHSTKLQDELRWRGVRRIWPNLYLHPQSASFQNDLSTGLRSVYEAIGADPQPSDGEGVTWALVDTDVYESHAALVGLNLERWEISDQAIGCVKSDQPFPRPAAACEHGTHLAGIIYSLAPAVHLVSYALKARRGADGQVRLNSTGHLEHVFEKIAERKDITGVNVSLGILPKIEDTFAGQSPGCKALGDCYLSGKIVVVAAGNYGRGTDRFEEVSITDPANSRYAFVVGACGTIDPDGEGVCSFSSHGPTADGREKPDIVAPGVEVRSCTYPGPGNFINQDGTSQAAAVASGAIAALQSRLPSRKNEPDFWCGLVCETARTLNRLPTYQGHGLLQFQLAAAQLREATTK